MPAGKGAFKLRTDLTTRLATFRTLSHQPVIVGVFISYMCDYSQFNRFLVQSFGRRGSAYAPTVFQACVRRNALGTIGRAAWDLVHGGAPRNAP